MHGAVGTRIVNCSSWGDGKWAGGEEGHDSLNLPHATWHLVMEASSQLPPEDKSPLDNRGMAPPQASRDLLWPLVIGLPFIGLACPVYRLHLKQGSVFRVPGITLYFLWIQLEQPPQNMEFVPKALRQTSSKNWNPSSATFYTTQRKHPGWTRLDGFRSPNSPAKKAKASKRAIIVTRDTCHMGLRRTSDAHRVPAQASWLWLYPCWPEVPFLPFLPYESSRWSASLAVPHHEPISLACFNMNPRHG